MSGTVDALAVAERIANADERQLELRLLNVPALYLMSVWLQPASKKGADDGVFVPIAPAPPGFEANRTYDRSQFTEALGSAARSVPEVGRDDTQGGS